MAADLLGKADVLWRNVAERRGAIGLTAGIRGGEGTQFGADSSTTVAAEADAAPTAASCADAVALSCAEGSQLVPASSVAGSAGLAAASAVASAAVSREAILSLAAGMRSEFPAAEGSHCESVPAAVPAGVAVAADASDAAACAENAQDEDEVPAAVPADAAAASDAGFADVDAGSDECIESSNADRCLVSEERVCCN